MYEITESAMRVAPPLALGAFVGGYCGGRVCGLFIFYLLFTKCWFPRCLSFGLGIARMVVPSSVQDRHIVVVSQSGISFMAIAGSVYGLVA